MANESNSTGSPASPKREFDSAYWRRKANETQQKARSLSDEQQRQRMLRVAIEYEKLAILADGKRLD